MLATLEAKAITGLVGFVLIFGLFFAVEQYGKRAQKQADQIIFDQMKQAALQQQVAAKQQEVAQNETTSQVAESYSAELDRLNAALSVPKHIATTSRTVRPASLSSIGSHAAIGQLAPSCSNDFRYNALKDALTIKAWQDWATSEKIPVAK